MAKILNRWNRQKGDYEPYEVPDDRRCKTFCIDMDEIVDCACCGTALPFGRMYTSLEIHTRTGAAYAVCEKCYKEERRREMSC